MTSQFPAWQFAEPPTDDGVQALIIWVRNMERDVRFAQEMIKQADDPEPPS